MKYHFNIIVIVNEILFALTNMFLIICTGAF